MYHRKPPPPIWVEQLGFPRLTSLVGSHRRGGGHARYTSGLVLRLQETRQILGVNQQSQMASLVIVCGAQVDFFPSALADPKPLNMTSICGRQSSLSFINKPPSKCTCPKGQLFSCRNTNLATSWAAPNTCNLNSPSALSLLATCHHLLCRKAHRFGLISGQRPASHRVLQPRQPEVSHKADTHPELCIWLTSSTDQSSAPISVRLRVRHWKSLQTPSL